MLLEAVAAGLLGLAALWLVLQPLLDPRAPPPRPVEPADPEETPRGLALAALKEIEFDRETGKLSDADYELLKARYTAAALEALREDASTAQPGQVEAMIAGRVRALRDASTGSSPACPSCGPRPEQDAIYCSSCGLLLPRSAAGPG